jgi:hypothetical protein
MHFIIVSFTLFVLLCYAAVALGRASFLERFGPRPSIVFIAISVLLLFLWYELHLYWPPLTIWEHWRMLALALVGFLSAVAALSSAIKTLRGDGRLGMSVISIGIGLTHLLFLIGSIPVS